MNYSNHDSRQSPAPRMVVPKPQHEIFDRVTTWRDTIRQGTITGRRFDNLIHAREWIYGIKWDDGKETNHHLCGDLRKA